MSTYAFSIDVSKLSPERYKAILNILKSSGRVNPDESTGFYFSKNGLEGVKGIANHPGVEMFIWAENAPYSEGVFAGR